WIEVSPEIEASLYVSRDPGPEEAAPRSGHEVQGGPQATRATARPHRSRFPAASRPHALSRPEKNSSSAWAAEKESGLRLVGELHQGRGRGRDRHGRSLLHAPPSLFFCGLLRRPLRRLLGTLLRGLLCGLLRRARGGLLCSRLDRLHCCRLTPN